LPYAKEPLSHEVLHSEVRVRDNSSQQEVHWVEVPPQVAQFGEQGMQMFSD